MAATATASDALRWIDVGSIRDFGGSGPHAVSVNAAEIVIVKRQGELFAFNGLCPHKGALLGEGEVDGDELICRNHRWRFDAKSGQRHGGPQCLVRYSLRQEEGRLLVGVPSAERLETEKAVAKRWSDLPGPRGVPIFGNALQLSVPHLHENLEAWSRQYGKHYAFKVGSTPAFVVDDAELASRALRARPGTFRRSSKIEALFRELGVHGVFSAEGDEWRPQRRLVMGALAQRNLVSYYPVLKLVTERLLAHWLGKAAKGEVIHIQDDLMRFTVDVTTTLAFGRDVNTIDGGNDIIQDKIQPIFPALARRLNAVVPYWRILRLPKDRKLDRALKGLQEWMSTIIEETRDALAESPERTPKNFLELMLKTAEHDGENFDERVILANALTMLLAGEDTTANTLAWAVHHLCDSPGSVSALRREAEGTIGDASLAETIEVTRDLPYADAVANEAMRLRPVAPILLLEARDDTILGDLDVRAGEVVFLLMRMPCIDDAAIPNAGAFEPSRWLDADDAAIAKINAVHMPFGSGPRICPGRSLALLEMRMVLSMLYKNFEVERVGQNTEVTELFNFAMMPVGLRVKLRPLRSS